MSLPDTSTTVMAADMETIRERDLPAKTWKLDVERGSAAQIIDDKESVAQAILLSLSTIRWAHLIYSEDYGLENMVGSPMNFARVEFPRRVAEAILQDDRVTSVAGVKVETTKDEFFVSCLANTVYGDVKLLRERIPK